MKTFLIYAHDGVGYGHIARMANLAHLIKKHIPASNILFVSGYYNINNFLEEDIGMDYIKLPYNNKVRIHDHADKDILVNSSKLLRKKIIKSIFVGHEYDYIIVDFFPFGTKGELFQYLKGIRRNYSKTKIILTQRGIAFSKEMTLDLFRNNFGIKYVNEVFDKVICFCDKRIIDINDEYFDRKINIPIKYLGYIHSKLQKNFFNNKNGVNILIDFGGGYKCDAILILV